MKGYAVRAAGSSETTHPPPTPGRDHPSAQPQRPENSRIQPLVLDATRLHSDPPFGKPPLRALLGGGLGGGPGGGLGGGPVSSHLELGLQAPSWRRGALGVPWLPSQDPTLVAPRKRLPGPAESSPDNTFCARGAGPQSCPLTAGTSLRPVARQPPGATRATAILISPRPLCFHCISALGPGSQDGPAQGSSSLESHLWGAGADPRFLQPRQSRVTLESSGGPMGGALDPATGHIGPRQPAASSPALGACPSAVSRKREETSVESVGVLSSPAWDRVNRASKTEKRPVSPSGVRVPAAVRPTWSAIPSPQDCTNSPSCICIKISCKEQLALY